MDMDAGFLLETWMITQASARITVIYNGRPIRPNIANADLQLKSDDEQISYTIQ